MRDCAAVITANPRASKAYYRAGLALLALERVDEALDVVVRAGEGAADDAGFRTLRARAEKKRDELGRKEKEQRERVRRAAEEKRRMDAALAVRYSLPPSFPHMTLAHDLTHPSRIPVVAAGTGVNRDRSEI